MIQGVIFLPFYLIGQTVLAALVVIPHTYKDNKLLLLVIGGVYLAVLTFVLKYLWQEASKSSRCKDRKKIKPVDSVEMDKLEPIKKNDYSSENKLLMFETINEELKRVQQNKIKNNKAIQQDKKVKKKTKANVGDDLGFGSFDFDKFCKETDL